MSTTMSTTMNTTTTTHTPPHDGDDVLDDAPPGAPDDRRTTDPGPTRRARSIVVAAGLVVIALLAAWMIRTGAEHSDEAAARQRAAFEDITGIRVLRVVMTGGGGLVELHYQVLDPDKALTVHDDETPPALVDEATGRVVAIPFHDHKNRELHTAVTYREMFMNGGGLLDHGSTVTLTVGDAEIEHIEVQ